jgi:cytochrome b pre-mRNA-processing protein 3
MFNYFKNRKLINNASDSLFMKLNQYARNPCFFGDDLVPDDPDGRFELVVLFATAIFIGLAGRGEFASQVSQRLFDKVFKTFDQALRDFGVSDLKVGKRVKIMAESFYGRQNSYINAFATDDVILLEQKISLNVFGKEDEIVEFSKILAQNFTKLVDETKKQPI